MVETCVTLGTQTSKNISTVCEEGRQSYHFYTTRGRTGSDASHKNFVDINVLLSLGEKLGLKVQKLRSFPFPRFVGRFFKYNEFNCVFFT